MKSNSKIFGEKRWNSDWDFVVKTSPKKKLVNLIQRIVYYGVYVGHANQCKRKLKLLENVAYIYFNPSRELLISFQVFLFGCMVHMFTLFELVVHTL